MTRIPATYLAGAVAALSLAAGTLVFDHWRAARSEGRLAFVLANAREIPAYGAPPLHDGDLVLVADVPTPAAPVVDPDLGFAVDALTYSRTVEMLQWREIKSTVDGEERVRYVREWSDHPRSSIGYRLGHHNYGTFPFRSASFTADRINLGEFALHSDFMKLLPGAERLPMTPDMYARMPERYKAQFALRDGRLVPFHDAGIGDVRASFRAVRGTLSTVVGAFEKGSIVPAATEAGEVAILRSGNLSKEQLVDAERSSSGNTTIALRVLAGIFASLSVLIGWLGVRTGSAPRA